MYNVTFLNRDFSLRIQPPIAFTVDSLQWSIEGGPSLAQLSASITNLPALSLIELLRSPVQVWNSLGRVIWWGYLESIEFQGIRVDLASMANHIQAMYTFSVNEGISTSVQKLYTPWISDTWSQADYGLKERIIPAGEVPLQQAISRCDQAFTDHGRPRPTILPSRLSAEAARTGGATGVSITCRGWWDTLGWIYYANPDGLVSYTNDGVGFQIYDGYTCDKFAQSWQAPTSGWSLSSVWFKVSKAGNPVDNITVSLVADVAGLPGGTVLSSCTLAGSSISMDYAWTEFPLTPFVPIGMGIYWFVIVRSGARDFDNFYKFKFNESCGYPSGVLKIMEGVHSTWIDPPIPADLNFIALGSLESTLQIANIADPKACGQFLSGVKIEDASGLFSSPFRSGSRTGLQEIKDILASGNSAGESLVAFVDSARLLHVRRKPSLVQLSQGEDGIVRDVYGQVVPEDQVVAQWVKIERPGLELSDPQFITRVDVNKEGKVSLTY